MKYECPVCGFIYDESKENTAFAELPESWTCPVCGVPKASFKQIEENASDAGGAKQAPCSENLQTDTSNSDSQKTASDNLADALVQSGLRWVIGMVGHSNLGIADAFRRRAAKGELNFVGIRHEGAAAFACAAYGKLTGKPAACLSIAGPGATNMITGMCDANLDSAPAIAITGQVKSAEIGANLFQEIDLQKAFSCADAYSQTLFASTDCFDAGRRAWLNCVQNNSVSHIIAPDDIQVQKANFPSGKNLQDPPREVPSAPNAQDIQAAASFICKKSRPVILVGLGCANAMEQAKALAEKLNAPIMTTYRAKGFIEDSHPLACGVTGLSGTAVANAMMERSDCVIAAGVGFSRHTGVPKDKPVVQIDRNPRAMGARHSTDIALVGDCAETLGALLSSLPDFPSQPDAKSQIAAAWKDWRGEKLSRARQSKDGELSPSGLCDVLSKHVPGDAIVSVDVGNIAYTVGRCFESKRQRFLLSFYLGSIGVGLPSAIGAWCATRQEDSPFFGRMVVALVGDGGLGQYLAEWTTVAKYKMNIKCVVFNNSQLAKISAEQKNAHMPVWETSLLNPNFAEFSRSCGAEGFSVEKFDSLEGVLAQAFSNNGPALIDVKTSSGAIL